MYARTLRGALLAESHSDAINYFRQSIGPALRQQAGFLNGRLLSSSLTHHCLMVMVWESETDRRAAETDGFLQTLFQHMQQYFDGQPTSGHYEVQVQVV
ncbi:antibiotic biosynthesis monooxygenase family protein [Spirosoma koreense]